jgi:SPX domain protein involved in polyphosphate accumulation
MKFGATLKHLQVKGWEDKYVAYNTIKKLLKSSSTSQGKTTFGEVEEEAFVEQLDSELEKVSNEQICHNTLASTIIKLDNTLFR